MYENNCPLVIFLRLNGIAKIKNAKIKMLCFEAQIAKISNRRKYPLYGKPTHLFPAGSGHEVDVSEVISRYSNM